MRGNMKTIVRVANLKERTTEAALPNATIIDFFMSTKSIQPGFFHLKFEEPPTQSIFTDFIHILKKDK